MGVNRPLPFVDVLNAVRVLEDAAAGLVWDAERLLNAQEEHSPA